MRRIIPFTRNATEPALKVGSVVLHDYAVTIAALLLAVHLRGEPNLGSVNLLIPATAFGIFALVVYHSCSLYAARWRFASLFDLFGIVKAVTILTVVLLTADYMISPRLYEGTKLLGGRTLAIYWCLQIILLGGPRVAYRAYRGWRQSDLVRRDPLAAIVIGRASDADSVIRAVEAGLAGPIRVYGIVSPLVRETHQGVRGVPVWGTIENLEAAVQAAVERGITLQRAIIAPQAMRNVPLIENVIGSLRRLGIPAIRLDTTEATGLAPQARLHAIIDDDLLLRPLVHVDDAPLREFVRGKRIIVTGGGGSIGAELALRSAEFGAERVLVLDHSEVALHALLQRTELNGLDGMTAIEGRLCDVRDRARLIEITEAFAPDVVFHAAALKHLPHLEREVSDAVRTNVAGTVNAADAAIAAGAAAFVLVSTDKATKPASILGATKRIAELYTQSVGSRPGFSQSPSRRTRLVAVRFGNVLGTAGSVVPRFRAQIEAGGPVTVTHQDMVRFFMTKREATDLLLTAAQVTTAEAASAPSAILVLNMGQPVRIDDLARRMIRLAGFVPGNGIDITYVGSRPGERMSEILFEERESQFDIGIHGIVAAEAQTLPWPMLQPTLADLLAASDAGDDQKARQIISSLIPQIGTPGKVVSLPISRSVS
ncbi:MAG: polysaccharide biosynthesis protein [Phreatobacter sp.]|uniref:polysaccharide biosynthesis protein n=1 Tax=Phreatobacter sp. TaxID=1966341 RepID=UPI001A36B835|nr:polysaccharide biosynthesis protein [Phreatobacter sp.]MBL8571960.1 polysaccharide biosynthesis protein [Phreatobacter sp.]